MVLDQRVRELLLAGIDLEAVRSSSAQLARLSRSSHALQRAGESTSVRCSTFMQGAWLFGGSSAIRPACIHGCGYPYSRLESRLVGYLIHMGRWMEAARVDT